jgi:hypothetical protein
MELADSLLRGSCSGRQEKKKREILSVPLEAVQPCMTKRGMKNRYENGQSLFCIPLPLSK